MTIQDLHLLIRTRRSVYPNQYINREIPDQILNNILENAVWAPSHKLTQPWRFKLMKGESQKRFGIFMSEKYRGIEPRESFSIGKYEKLKMNPQKAGAVVAICIQRDYRERIPEWEEVASVAMAVQNMWLTCHGFGIGAYWSTPDLLQYFGEFENLNEGERYYIPNEITPPRNAASEIVKWL
jgi:nitroreductase